jgi:hypothetical protein
MMRTIMLAALIGLLWCFTGDSEAQPGPQNGGKPQGFVLWPREVSGYRKSVEGAEKDAIEKALARLVDCLKSQDPPLESWHPDEAYLKKNLLDGPGEQGKDFELDGVKWKAWVVTFKDSPNWSEMIQLNQTAQRREISAERQTMAGYVLAVLTALLALGWGYLRLDGWTNGRFTRWVCVLAAAIVGLAGLGWLTSN